MLCRYPVGAIDRDVRFVGVASRSENRTYLTQGILGDS